MELNHKRLVIAGAIILFLYGWVIWLGCLYWLSATHQLK